MNDVRIYRWPNQKIATLGIGSDGEDAYIQIGHELNSVTCDFLINKENRILEEVECWSLADIHDHLPEVRGMISGLRIPTHLWGVPLGLGMREFRKNLGIPAYREEQYNQIRDCVNLAVSNYRSMRDHCLSFGMAYLKDARTDFPDLDGRGMVGLIAIEVSRNYFDMKIVLSGGSSGSPGNLNCEVPVFYRTGSEGNIISGLESNPPEKIEANILKILREMILLVHPKDLEQWKKENVSYGEPVAVSREELDLFEAMGVGHPILWNKGDREAFFEERMSQDQVRR